MKKYLLLILAITTYTLSVIAQKKPTIMILPSDHWCDMRYFMTTYDNQGTKVKTPDYQKAFIEDTEIGPVISKIGQVLTDMGYSLKDAEQEIKSINTKTAEDNVTMSKTSGASLVESPLDMLKRRIKCDILIQISWNLSRSAGGRSTTFTLEAFDSYTNKRIATSTGSLEGQGPVADLLFAAVKKNLETEYGGEELTDCIQSWLRNNCVNSAFNLSDGTESFAQFEQVRIPLEDEKGKTMDARAFATLLRKHLAKPPYNITAKVMQRGLGEAILVLGEK